MAVTRLKRKSRRNKNVAKEKIAVISRLNAKPVIKSIDIASIKEEFKKNISKFEESHKKETKQKAENVGKAVTKTIAKPKKIKIKSPPKS